MKNLIIIILLLFCPLLLLFGQIKPNLNTTPEAQIALTARGFADSIQLRWAVSECAVFDLGLQYGYRIERAEQASPEQANEDLRFETLMNFPIKPWSADRVERVLQEPFNQTDEGQMAAMAYALTDPAALTPGSPLEGGIGQIGAARQTTENRCGFALMTADRSAAAASLLGLRYTDRTVKSGNTYIYRISLSGNSPVYRVLPGYTRVKAARQVFTAEENIVRYAERDATVVISVELPEELGGIYVERADETDGNFRSLHNEPIYSLYPATYNAPRLTGYADDSLTNGKTYRYRVYGTTAFADRELIGSFKATPRDLTPPAKPVLEQPVFENGKVELRWTYRDRQEDAAKGFRVFKAAAAEGPYLPLTTELLSVSTRTFTSEDFAENGENYYVITAEDAAGNRSRSRSAYLTIPDETPPEVPLLESGTVDSFGVVRINLRPAVAPDLLGYRLLRANAVYHEYTVVGETWNTIEPPTPKGSFQLLIDTVTTETLTREIWYRLVAVDENYNESEPSEPLRIIRPDNNPPVPPLIVNFSVDKTGVNLNCASSSSIDASRHFIYRSRTDSTEVKTFFIPEPDTFFTFRDSTALIGKQYAYSIQVEDKSGLKSPLSDSVVVVRYHARDFPGVLPEVRYDAEQAQMVVSWAYESDAEVKEFVLFRYHPLTKKTQQIYRSTNKTGIYRDDNSPDRTVRYAVKVYGLYDNSVPVYIGL